MNPHHVTVWLHQPLPLPRWMAYVGAGCAFLVFIELLAAVMFFLFLKLTSEYD